MPFPQLLDSLQECPLYELCVWAANAVDTLMCGVEPCYNWLYGLVTTACRYSDMWAQILGRNHFGGMPVPDKCLTKTSGEGVVL